MYAFITPMPLEEEAVLRECEIKDRKTLGYGELVVASYKKNDFIVAQCGIGKVFAAMMTQAVIDRFPEVDGIVVVGVAGSVDVKAAPLHSTVIASKLVQHDFDTSPIGDPIGELPHIHRVFLETSNAINTKLMEADDKASFGVIATGDQFIASKEKEDFIKENFGPYCVDMESAAVAQVCYANQIDFAVLRTISDAKNHVSEYVKNAEIAADKAGEIVRKFLTL